MIKVGIITASDKGSRGEREDLSVKAIEEVVAKIDGVVEKYTIVPDDRKIISKTIVEFVDEHKLDLILTTGGTGFSIRDVTPEATIDVIEKDVPGIAEVMRMKSLEITPRAMLSRAVSGIRKQTLIINLPGSPKGAKECLSSVIDSIPHGIEILKGIARECASNADSSDN
ncbi:MAG TPA: molybdopterin adenylyltransferase [Lachnospiraceae bacterium]|nr:molybdopterin adenylyltransferase [Lachnospiraceae bacterium]